MNFIWDNILNFSKNEKSISHKIKQNILFQDLTNQELKLVENIINVRTYRPGEVIFRQGEVGVGMYIISKGSVGIYVEEILPKTSETKTTHITELHQGDFFGDLALVEDNGKRSASAVANQECELIGFFKPDLIEVAERSPNAGVKILLRLGEVLALRLKETTARITELKKVTKE